jgi:predicted nucleic acid-binding protein
MKRTLLDTSVYIDWLNAGLHEALVVGPGHVRILSAVVALELRAGAMTPKAVRAIEALSRAYAAAQRLAAPPPAVYLEAGKILSRLRKDGREVRRASLLADTLIALTARSVGATLFTRDVSDFTAIREHVDFLLEPVRQ